MPHKHTRKGEDKDTVDLPPSTIAKPLSVNKSSNANGIFTSTSEAPARKAKKRKRNADKVDDTPKAFARLMAFSQGKRLPKSLDDGVKITKKEKKAANAAKTATNSDDANTAVVQKVVSKPEMPTIRPGEKMSDFSARVDAALPISGLINKTGKNGKDPLGLKVGRTKTEKRMHRMYDEWREQDKKIKDARQDALEQAEADDDDDMEGGVKWKVDMEAEEQSAGSKKKKGKGKKKKVLGEVDDGENDDPWAAVKKARNEAPNRLHDVVLAPPTFTKAPREKFKVRGAGVDVADVPKAAGSLRRREELGEVRRSVVEGYRKMMAENKEKYASRGQQ